MTLYSFLIYLLYGSGHRRRNEFKSGAARIFCRCLHFSCAPAMRARSAPDPLTSYGNLTVVWSLQWCEQDSRCRRLQLTDLLISPMQRCTKVPMMLNSIRQHTSLQVLSSSTGYQSSGGSSSSTNDAQQYSSTHARRRWETTASWRPRQARGVTQ